MNGPLKNEKSRQILPSLEVSDFVSVGHIFALVYQVSASRWVSDLPFATPSTETDRQTLKGRYYQTHDSKSNNSTTTTNKQTYYDYNLWSGTYELTCIHVHIMAYITPGGDTPIHWLNGYVPGYGFQAFEFRTGYINQENNDGNRVYNYIKLINSLIQVAINFLERHTDAYRIRVIIFSALIRVSSLEQGIKTKLKI